MSTPNAVAVEYHIPDCLVYGFLLRQYMALEGGFREEQHILERRRSNEPVWGQFIACPPYSGNSHWHLHTAIRFAGNVVLARLYAELIREPLVDHDFGRRFRIRDCFGECALGDLYLILHAGREADADEIKLLFYFV
ncbi:MAG: hypothetical protein M3506_09070, partial [Chloroflexota bacterium]|nr:hypothetical protein [Chloroflexota bacterium]